MKNKCCRDCEGYDLGWCVWKAKRTGEKSRACGWYKNELSRDTDVAERKGKKTRKENKQ